MEKVPARVYLVSLLVYLDMVEEMQYINFDQNRYSDITSRGTLDRLCV